jgi:hypothetical protein
LRPEACSVDVAAHELAVEPDGGAAAEGVVAVGTGAAVRERDVLEAAKAVVDEARSAP